MSEELKLPLNPNTKQAIALPPALVEAVQEDPELLVSLTRGQLAVVQDRMVQKVIGDPEASVAQLATVHKALSDNAQLKQQTGVTAGGQQLIVNFIVGGKKESLIVEGTAKQVPDAAG
jgi:hypothetical protein